MEDGQSDLGMKRKRLIEIFALWSSRGLSRWNRTTTSSNSWIVAAVGTGNVRTSVSGRRSSPRFERGVNFIITRPRDRRGRVSIIRGVDFTIALPSDWRGRPLMVVLTRISSSEIVSGA